MSGNINVEPAFPVSSSTVLGNIGQTALAGLPENASVEQRELVYTQAVIRSAQGISVRDYFASAAMQGICSHPETWGLSTSTAIAAKAYELADAMLAARAE